MIGLRIAASHTGNNAEFSARIQLLNQRRAGTEVQIAVGKCTAGGFVYLNGDINQVLILNRSGSLNLEHGVDRVCTLLGDKELAADILLVRRCGGVGDRCGDGILLDLDLRNVGRNHQLQLAGVIGTLRGQVTLQNAYRNIGPLRIQGEREVIALGGRAVHAANHIERAINLQLGFQFCLRSEVQIAVGERAAGGGIHLNGDVDVLIILHCSGSAHFEHGIHRSRRVRFRHKQLTGQILLFTGGIRIGDRSRHGGDLSLSDLRDNQFQLTGVIGALRGQIALQDAHGNAGPLRAERQGDVIALSVCAIHAADHVERAINFQLRFQFCLRSEVQIAVGERAAGSGIYLDSNVDILIVLHCSSSAHIEHGVDRIYALLGNEQFAGHALLIEGSGRIRNGSGYRCDLPLGDLGNDQFQLTGIIRTLCSQVALQNAHGNAGTLRTERQRKVVTLSCATVYTRNNVEFSARIQLGNQVGAGAKIQVAIGERAAGGGIHLDGDVDVLIVLHRGSSAHIKHGIDRIYALLGDKQLTADILLAEGSGRVGNRSRYGILLDLDLLNVGRNHQLQFAGVVGGTRGQVALKDADRDAGSCRCGRQREVEDLSIAQSLKLNRFTANHIEPAARFQLFSQRGKVAEVQIVVGKYRTGRGSYIDGNINIVLVLDSSCLLNLENAADIIGALLGNKQLAAHILLFFRGSRILHRMKTGGYGSLVSIICIQRKIRNRHGGNGQLLLLQQIAALLGCIRGDQAHSDAGIISRANGEMEHPLAVIEHALCHGERAALAHPLFQRRLGAEIQIAIGAERRHAQRRKQRTAAANRSSAADGEIPADVGSAGIDNIHAINQRFLCRGSKIEHRFGIGSFLLLFLGLCFFRLCLFGFSFFRVSLFRIGLFRLSLHRVGFRRRGLRHLLGRSLCGRLGRSLGGCLGGRLCCRFLRGGRRLYFAGDLRARLIFLSSGREHIAYQHRNRQQQCKDSRP